MTTLIDSKIKYSTFKYLVEISIWMDVGTQGFGFAVSGNGKPVCCPYASQKLAEKAARQIVNRLKKEAILNQSYQVDARNIHS